MISFSRLEIQLKFENLKKYRGSMQGRDHQNLMKIVKQQREKSRNDEIAERLKHDRLHFMKMGRKQEEEDFYSMQNNLNSISSVLANLDRLLLYSQSEDYMYLLLAHIPLFLEALKTADCPQESKKQVCQILSNLSCMEDIQIPQDEETVYCLLSNIESYPDQILCLISNLVGYRKYGYYLVARLLDYFDINKNYGFIRTLGNILKVSKEQSNIDRVLLCGSVAASIICARPLVDLGSLNLMMQILVSAYEFGEANTEYKEEAIHLMANVLGSFTDQQEIPDLASSLCKMLLALAEKLVKTHPQSILDCLKYVLKHPQSKNLLNQNGKMAQLVMHLSLQSHLQSQALDTLIAYYHPEASRFSKLATKLIQKFGESQQEVQIKTIELLAKATEQDIYYSFYSEPSFPEIFNCILNSEDIGTDLKLRVLEYFSTVQDVIKDEPQQNMLLMRITPALEHSYNSTKNNRLRNMCAQILNMATSQGNH